MRNTWVALVGLLLVAGLGAGCDDGGSSDEAAGYEPAIDANGRWSVQADGAPLGTMDLVVSAAGRVSGTLTTAQGAIAQLAGAMDEYNAEFTVDFPAENYLAALTFTADAQAATGVLIDGGGFRQTLRLDRTVAAP
ncbi:MAG: hypothetical protein AB7V22_04780 [Kiritimatiellia bacterium]